jgi:phosphoserine aminotransferase
MLIFITLEACDILLDDPPGGLEAQKKLNEEKAKVLYDTIAASNGFYSNPVEPSVRSLMNVPFTIPSNPDLEKAFVKETEKLGLVRWSCYHSPVQAADLIALYLCMVNFYQLRYGPG